jgi:RNA polymerase sigma-70 factor (ECF subfamily)
MEARAALSSAPLSSALLGALEGTRSADSDGIAGLERVLESVVRDARAKWPLLRVDAIEFVRHLARGIADDVPLGDAVQALATEDLYLAFACISRDRAALAAFDAQYLGEVGSFVARVSATPGFVDEVRQALRDKLLGGKPGEPGIAAYSGRGAIAGWVRIVALRVALNLQRSSRRKATHEKAAASLDFDVALTPELVYLSVHYRLPFAEALRT